MLAWSGAALVLSMPARGETLVEAYKLALQSDPKYKGAQAEALAVGTATDQALAGFLPTVKFDWENTETRQRVLSTANPTLTQGLATYPTHNKTLTVTQPIFRKDVIERYAQAQAVVRQAGFTLLAAEQDLLLRTTAAYLVVLAAQDNVALAGAERETVGKVLEFASAKLKSGLGTVTNQHDATARFAAAKAREIEAQHKLRDARQGLREITGKLIESMQTLREDFPLEVPQPAAIEPWLDSALEQNLTLRSRKSRGSVPATGRASVFSPPVTGAMPAARCMAAAAMSRPPTWWCA
jgi:outer membrane protein